MVGRPGSTTGAMDDRRTPEQAGGTRQRSCFRLPTMHDGLIEIISYQRAQYVEDGVRPIGGGGR